RAEGDRDPRRDRDRLVEVVRVEEHHTADLLLRLGIGPVGDERLTVTDAHGLRGLRALELRAKAELAGRAELVEERLPLWDLLRPRSRRLLGAHLLPHGDVIGVAREDGCVLHATSPSSACTGRTSIAPCLAAGILAAQLHASSIESHSKT